MQLPEASIFNVSQIEILLVTAIHVQIQQATHTDPCLSKLLQYTCHGWPFNVPQCMKPYLSRQNELAVEEDCVLWGIQVDHYPMKLHGRILDELHQNHTGMSQMKSLSRSFVWWPGLDQSIEEVVKSCTACQSIRDSPAVAPVDLAYQTLAKSTR